MRRKKSEGSSPSGGDGRITPVDVQQVEFRLAFRGYKERDVDAFLDRITEDLAAYLEENQRLRAGVPVAPAPVPSSAHAGDARAEADRIVAEAREEAARIVREAEGRAAAVGAPTGDTRAAVAPFLNTEREFLQRLGSLVQGHAEDIKQMVAGLRARSEGPGASLPSTATAPPPPAPGSGSPEVVAQASPATTTEEAFAPISVPAGEDDAESEASSQPAPVQLRQDSGDRSLRELFWGED